MSRLRRRLARLQTGNRPCSECGYGTGLPEYVVEWIGLNDPPTPEPPACNSCGRPEIVIDSRTIWDIPEGET